MEPRLTRENTDGVAVDLILADGIVRDEEEEFIYRLQHQLQIDPHLALQITRVITIKNQC